MFGPFRPEMLDWKKHTSLLQRFLNYGQIFYNIGPCKAPALPAIVRLGWKWLTVANTLAYCDIAKATAAKGVIVQAPGAIPMKKFMNKLTLSFSQALPI